jgi:hypothetical protein
MHEEATDVDDHANARSRPGFRAGIQHFDDRQNEDNDHQQPEEGRQENYNEKDIESKDQHYGQEHYPGEVNSSTLLSVESGPIGPLSFLREHLPLAPLSVPGICGKDR